MKRENVIFEQSVLMPHEIQKAQDLHVGLVAELAGVEVKPLAMSVREPLVLQVTREVNGFAIFFDHDLILWSDFQDSAIRDGVRIADRMREQFLYLILREQREREEHGRLDA